MSADVSAKPVAIVTGGGRGIGAAVAAALVADGHHVVIIGRDGGRLEETAARIGAEPIAADVTEPGGAGRVVDDVVDRYGRIDVLVNNAGISGGGPLVSVAAEDWWRVLEVNVYGPMAYMQAVLGHMVPMGSGIVFNIGSFAGVRPLPGASAYATSKAALARITDSVAAEVESAGVTIMCLSPGLVETDMTRGVPVFDDVPADEWESIDRIGELVISLIARPDIRRLTGRFVHVRDDLDELCGAVDRIGDQGLYQLRMESLEGRID